MNGNEEINIGTVDDNAQESATLLFPSAVVNSLGLPGKVTCSQKRFLHAVHGFKKLLGGLDPISTMCS